MDPLSDLLRIVRLDGAYFYAVEATAPWRVEALAATLLKPRVLPTAEHLISYHIVTEGRCYGGVVGDEQVELGPGDVILFPHGDTHVMASGPDVQSGIVQQEAVPATSLFTLAHAGGGSSVTTFVCGFLGCDRRPFNPLLASLPRRMHLRGLSNAWLSRFIRQMTEESRGGAAGAASVLTRLAEVMFIEALRRYMSDLPEGQTGWLAGLRDPLVGKALAQLHARPGHPWTLPGLAREIASSRSSLARRFTQLMGQPPMQYLAQWRMQVAADLLARTGAKLGAISAEVGYDSEAAFSRAFKKATGLSPGAWRDRRQEGRVGAPVG